MNLYAIATSRFRRTTWALILVLALALGTRLWRMTYHSFNFDEAQSAHLAAQPAATILADGLQLRTDPHPPLYYLAQHGWTRLFGDGDASVRTLGALIGAILAGAVYWLGLQMGGRRWALLAGLMAALNPYLVWYSQESRIFMLGTSLGVLSFALLLAVLRRSRWTWWLAYVLAATGSVYSFLFTAFLLPVEGLFVSVWWLANRRARNRRFLAALLALIAVAAAVMPIMRVAWRVAARENLSDAPFVGLGPFFTDLYHAYTLHLADWPAPWVAAALAVGGLLALTGFLAPAHDGGEPTKLARPALWLWLLVPFLAAYVLLFLRDGVFGGPRYFIFMAPLLCLAWGRGLDRLFRWRSWAGLVGTLLWSGVLLVALSANWSPQHLREDWRTAAQYVEQQEGPNDAVLVHVDYLNVAFNRYYEGISPVFFPFSDRLADPAQVEPPLMGLLSFDTVWLVQAHTLYLDPDQRVERWLADRFPLATEQYPNGVTVKRFITRYRLPAPPTYLPPIDAPFGPAIDLAACQAAPQRTPATDERSHPPSAWVHVTLFWRANAIPAGDYTTRARLVDAAGQVWGERLYRERETLRLWPTSRWQAGEIVREELDVNLNPITPPGDYRLIVGMLDDKGQALGPEVICAAVETEN